MLTVFVKCAVIFTAINFLAVVLFVPETRYDRGSEFAASQGTLSSTSEDELEAEKSAAQSEKEISDATNHQALQQLPKKTFFQELSLWSGVPSDTNLLEMFVRPFPLIVYPAIIYAL
jgi:hypothetical protein